MVVKKTTIFVTGHEGFIASRLISELQKDESINIVTYIGNLLHENKLKKFLKINRPNTIVHLAGNFSNNFNKLMSSNVKTTEIIARIAGQTFVEKLILASSGAVYGNYKNTPYLETDVLLPRTIYGLSKKMAEDCLLYYQRLSEFSTIILRFSNVYDRDKGNGVVSNFSRDIKSKKEITIRGDGLQERNFLHVQDACSAILKAIEYQNSDIFNISSQINLSIRELASLYKSEYEFKIIYKKNYDNQKNLDLNYEKAVAKLHYKPNVNKLEI